MKANRAFRSRDDAVSPVIAVILMVAITVVLAATVYVWVSGFGSQSGTPAKTIALTSTGAISNGDKTYSVASATPGMRWLDITLTVDGTTVSQFTHVAGGASCSSSSDITNASWFPCSGATSEVGQGTVDAGDTVRIGGVSSGQTLRVLDSAANSVIVSLVIG
jgi:flagellin-like protein